MADQDDKLRLPRTVSEAVALAGAFGICFGAAFVVNPVVEQLGQIPENLRGYLSALPMGALPLLNNGFKQAIARARSSRDGPERTDLPSWFVSGALAGGSLVAWYWFTSFLGKFTATQAVNTAMLSAGDADAATLSSLVQNAAGLNATVLTLVAAVVAGRMLNRFTRSGVLLALVVMSVAYLAVNFTLAWYFNPTELRALVQDTTDAGTAAIAGMVVGFALVPVALFVMGLVGVLMSRVNRERSMGRLTNAARPLDDEARHALTEQILAQTR